MAGRPFGRDRNIDRSTIGSLARLSTNRNTARETAATANAPRMTGDVQPRFFPSISA
jgi:hypothetical protein